MSEPVMGEPQRFRNEVRRAGAGGVAAAGAAGRRVAGTLVRRGEGRGRR